LKRVSSSASIASSLPDRIEKSTFVARDDIFKHRQFSHSFHDVGAKVSPNLKYWVMHPVARVSTNIYRNLRTQQMSVLVLLCASYTTCFGHYWWPSSGGFVTQKIRRQLTVCQRIRCVIMLICKLDINI
jgi:hypothetical protein